MEYLLAIIIILILVDNLHISKKK